MAYLYHRRSAYKAALEFAFGPMPTADVFPLPEGRVDINDGRRIKRRVWQEWFGIAPQIPDPLPEGAVDINRTRTWQRRFSHQQFIPSAPDEPMPDAVPKMDQPYRKHRRAPQWLTFPPLDAAEDLPPSLGYFSDTKRRTRRNTFHWDTPQQPPLDASFFPTQLGYSQPPRRIRRSKQLGDALFRSIDTPRAITLFGDALRWWFSGAASDGGAQASQAASLGNYRSSTEADRIGVLYVQAIPNITILQASRAIGIGTTATIFAASDDTVQFYVAGSSTETTPITILNGETKVLTDPDNTERSVRIMRTSATALSGATTFETVDIFNDVFSMSDADNTEQGAGGNRYRGVFGRNEEVGFLISGIKLYIGTLQGSTAVSSVTQLGGAGSGTITGATDAFCGWEQTGWCRIVDSGGTLREIVYYSSRTDTALTVPALGRGRLGTSATAGSATDSCYPVPGFRIAYEASSPATGGTIQTIADESTAPTGVTWSTAITAAAGISVGSIASLEQFGVWIHRELPAGVTATAKMLNLIKAQFTLDGVTYTETLAGLLRIADTDIERYELHIGVNAFPDVVSGTPAETFTSLPHTTTATLTDSATNYVVTQFRNRYNLVSQSMDFDVFRLSGGSSVGLYPSAPSVTIWQAYTAGAFKLQAIYNLAQDTSPADTWLIYIRTDGTNPDPSIDSPVTQTMAIDLGLSVLNYTTATFAHGTTGKVIVRVRRTGTPNVDSQNVDVKTATADATGPSAPTGNAFYRGIAQEEP